MIENETFSVITFKKKHDLDSEKNCFISICFQCELTFNGEIITAFNHRYATTPGLLQKNPSKCRKKVNESEELIRVRIYFPRK